MNTQYEKLRTGKTQIDFEKRKKEHVRQIMKTKLADAEEQNRQAQKAKECLKDEIDLMYGIKTRRVKNMLRKLNKEMRLLRSELKTKNKKKVSWTWKIWERE